LQSSLHNGVNCNNVPGVNAGIKPNDVTLTVSSRLGNNDATSDKGEVIALETVTILPTAGNPTVVDVGIAVKPEPGTNDTNTVVPVTVVVTVVFAGIRTAPVTGFVTALVVRAIVPSGVPSGVKLIGVVPFNKAVITPVLFTVALRLAAGVNKADEVTTAPPSLKTGRFNEKPSHVKPGCTQFKN